MELIQVIRERNYALNMSSPVPPKPRLLPLYFFICLFCNGTFDIQLLLHSEYIEFHFNDRILSVQHLKVN